MKSIEEIVAVSTDTDGRMNDFGKHLIARLAPHLGPIHKTKWGPAFVPITRLLVRTNVDLAIYDADEGKFLLKWRDDTYFRGWHFPGGSLGPGESLEEAVQRLSESELGARIIVQKEIACLNCPDNPRSHDACYLMLCVPASGSRHRWQTSEHRWFRECPQDIIPVHLKHWQAAENSVK